MNVIIKKIKENHFRIFLFTIYMHARKMVVEKED